MQGRFDGILLLKHSSTLAQSFCLFEQSRGMIFWRVASLVANWRHLSGFLQGDYTLEVNQGVAHVLSYLLLKAGSLKVLNHRILPVLLR